MLIFVCLLHMNFNYEMTFGVNIFIITEHMDESYYI